MGCQFFKKCRFFFTPTLLRDTDLRKGTMCPFCVPIHKERKKEKVPVQLAGANVQDLSGVTWLCAT